MEINFDGLVKTYTNAIHIIAWHNRDPDRYQREVVSKSHWTRNVFETVFPRLRRFDLWWNHIICRWVLADFPGGEQAVFETMAAAMARLTTWLKDWRLTWQSKT